jgi:hypothetical protein
MPSVCSRGASRTTLLLLLLPTTTSSCAAAAAAARGCKVPRAQIDKHIHTFTCLLLLLFSFPQQFFLARQCPLTISCRQLLLAIRFSNTCVNNFLLLFVTAAAAAATTTIAFFVVFILYIIHYASICIRLRS